MPGEKRKIYSQVALFLPLVCIIYAADRVTKYFAVTFLDSSGSVLLLKNFLYLTLVHNTGAAFGIFRAYPSIFIAIGIFAILLLMSIFFLYREKLTTTEKLALIFIFSGTLGNLTDRIYFGKVIDFIDIRVWPVFNVADIFITLGAVLLLVSIFLHNRKRKKGECTR